MEFAKIKNVFSPIPSKIAIEIGKIKCTPNAEGGVDMTRKLFDGTVREFSLTQDQIKLITLK
jgi:hypothetical protein